MQTYLSIPVRVPRIHLRRDRSTLDPEASGAVRVGKRQAALISAGSVETGPHRSHESGTSIGTVAVRLEASFRRAACGSCYDDGVRVTNSTPGDGRLKRWVNAAPQSPWPSGSAGESMVARSSAQSASDIALMLGLPSPSHVA